MKTDAKLSILVCACAVVAVLAFSGQAWAVCGISGYVYCDVNQSGVIDEGDEPLAGVVILLDGAPGATTNADGSYATEQSLAVCLTTTVSLDPASLPADASFIDPSSNGVAYVRTASTVIDWLIDSETCHPQEQGMCWLTGGGAKFESLAGMYMAERNEKGGPRDSFGGNVAPSCSLEPGDGGQWNHIAHSLKLHFQGWSVETVACGNVVDHEPGSESPVTPYNFIEFEGTGTLKGIKGNKDDFGDVYFFARCEDRNEPGNESASEGSYIDRYFLNVFADPGDPVGTSLLLIDMDGDPSTVDPVTITKGNLQLHISSCDN